MTLSDSERENLELLNQLLLDYVLRTLDAQLKAKLWWPMHGVGCEPAMRTARLHLLD